MGLDVYVGSLTRYYAHDWKTIVQQYAEAQGMKFRLDRPPEPSDAVTDKKKIRQAVLGWRLLLERGLGSRLRSKLDWDESDAAPYFTDKPDFDGWNALRLSAASVASGQPLPDTLPADWTQDPKWKDAAGRSPWRHLVEPYIWLPADFDDVFVAESLAGSSLTFGSSLRLKEQLIEFNRQTQNASKEQLARWRFEGPGEPLAQLARFGLAVFSELADRSVGSRLPMLLDY